MRAVLVLLVLLLGTTCAERSGVKQEDATLAPDANTQQVTAEDSNTEQVTAEGDTAEEEDVEEKEDDDDAEEEEEEEGEVEEVKDESAPVAPSDAGYASPCPKEELPATSTHAEGMCTWVPVAFESFESGVFGWSNNTISSCGGCTKSQAILGGHCNFGPQEVYKQFDELPEHNLLRVVSRYSFIDDWQKETGYMKVDDHLVWTKRSTDATWTGLNQCGGTGHDFTGIALDVVVGHADDCAKISFGSNLDRDPCSASYGIGPVQIFTCMHCAHAACRDFS
jgi:hypothetical protein